MLNDIIHHCAKQSKLSSKKKKKILSSQTCDTFSCLYNQEMLSVAAALLAWLRWHGTSEGLVQKICEP